MEFDQNGLEVLDRKECLRLLGRRTLGRIGFTRAALPVVLPISFHLDGERVLVRTRRGGRLDVALRNAIVAFEVDDVRDSTHAGWSVALTGSVTPVSDPGDLDAMSEQPAERWYADADDSLLSISTEILTGRRTAAAHRLP